MIILLHFVQGLLAFLALGLFLSFTHTRNAGLLLAALIYAGAAVASFGLMAWWPLAVGFASAWGLRLLGVDPA